MSIYGLAGAADAINGFFSAKNEEEKRKAERERQAREAERFEWEREDQTAKREMRPVEQEARRSTLKTGVMRDEATRKTLPGETENTITQQGLTAQRLRNQTENLPSEFARLKTQGVLDDQKISELSFGHLGTFLKNGDMFGAVTFANKIASHPEILTTTNGQKVIGFDKVTDAKGKVTAYKMRTEGGGEHLLNAAALEQLSARVNAAADAPVLNKQKIEADIRHSDATGRAAVTSAGAAASNAATNRLQLTAPTVVQGNETGAVVRPQITVDPVTKQPTWADPVVTPNKDIPAKGGVRGMTRDQYDNLVNTSTSEFEKNIGFTANPMGQMMMPEGFSASEREVYSAVKAKIEQSVRGDPTRDANGNAAVAAELYNRAIAIRKASPKLSAKEAIKAAEEGTAGTGKGNAATHLVD